MLRPITRLELVVDAAIAGVFAVLLGVLPLLLAGDLATASVAALLAAGLLLRRWSPALALVAAWAAAVLQMGLGLLAAAPGIAPSPLDAAIPPVVYACAAYGGRGVRWAAFTSSLVGAGIAGVYVARSVFAATAQDAVPDWSEPLHVFGVTAALAAVTLLLAWTIGLLVRVARQSRLNRQEAVEAGRRAAAEQERTRIARDMHDVVAHSLAVVIAQSDGARLLRASDPEAVEEALQTIGSVSRAALADVRVLLQQLRSEGATGPGPALGDLDGLVAGFRSSGLDVALTRRGDLTALPAPVQIAAFRIVQESLTNALRHGARADVGAVVARTPAGLEIEVVNGLDPDRGGRPVPGHGLIGMRERAASVGGELDAAPVGERFRVRAVLPVGATDAAPTRRALEVAG